MASKRLASIVLSFDTDFSSVSLVESPPRDLHNYVAYVSRRGGGGGQGTGWGLDCLCWPRGFWGRAFDNLVPFFKGKALGTRLGI